MLTKNDDGTCTAGKLDVLLIYRNVHTNTYHPVFFELSEAGGDTRACKNLTVLRLKYVHHLDDGASSLEGARELVEQMRTYLTIDDRNVYGDDAVPWNGTPNGTMYVRNWRRKGQKCSFRLLDSVHTA